MRTCVALGVSLAMAGFTGACGDSDTELGSEQRAQAYEDYVSELTELLCESSASCCGIPNFPLRDCKLALPFLAERPDPEKFVFHQDLADQCLAEVRVTTACAPTPEVCYRVVEGLVPGGATCETSLECASDGQFFVGNRCEGSETGRGQCSAPAMLGEACDGACTKDYCYHLDNTGAGLCSGEQGLRCGSTSRVCEAAVPAGGACAESQACDDGLTCNGSTCVPPPSVGEPCMLECAEGSYCNLGTCAPTVPLGSPCTLSECTPGACVAGVCRPTGFVCVLFGGGL